MNAFVKVQQGEAHLVIRAPLYPLQAGASFRSKNAQIDIANSAPAIERALAAIQQDVTCSRMGRALAASSASGGCRCRPTDRSRATSRRSATCPSRSSRGTGIYVDQGYFDARISIHRAAEFGVRHPHDGGAGARRLLKLALR